MGYVDKVLICVDCGKSFPFTVGEQRFFAQKGFSEPKHCHACRHYRKEQHKREETLSERSEAMEERGDKGGIGCVLASFITLVTSVAILYYGTQQEAPSWLSSNFILCLILIFAAVGSLITLIVNIFISGNAFVKRTIAVILGISLFVIGAVLPFFMPAIFILRIGFIPIPIPYLGNLLLVGVSVAFLYYGIRGKW